MTEDEPTLPEALRYFTDNRVRTHSEFCWRWHPNCAMIYAADLIEALQGDD